MLQQTRVSVVIPYFLRWMERFPTIEALSIASIEDVTKEWEGLGYYSRARNLHAGAQQVIAEYDGVLPVDELEKIKGIGEYTAGAIRAFAFRQKAAAVDGNVLRVMARFAGIGECIAAGSTKKMITTKVEELLPEEEPWLITEALIELGATACGKKALCRECPLREGCRAYQMDRTDELPVKTKKIVVQPLYRAVAVVTDGTRYLVQQGEEGKVMAGLYEFPYWKTDKKGWSKKQLLAAIEERLGCSVLAMKKLEKVQHGFTRYRAHLTPWLVTVDSPGEQWIRLEEMSTLPFSSGHRKISQQLYC
jgi:A/G-specific adenine glycosylase